MKNKKYAEIYGSPGARIRIAGLLQTQWPLIVAAILTGYLIRTALPVPQLNIAITGALFIGLAVAVIVAGGYSRRRLDDFLKGARGEETTARELSLLPEEFAVFHGLSIPMPNAARSLATDIDHVVVGPNGIFVIETKNWSDSISIKDGNLLYNNTKPSRPPLEQVKAAAKALQTFIENKTGDPQQLQPILCFASNNLDSDPQGAVGVMICNANDIRSLIINCGDSPVTDTKRRKITAALIETCEI